MDPDRGWQTSCLSERHAPGRVRRCGGEHGEEVLEFVHEGLEQKNGEKMNQDVRSGGTLIEPWRPLETDQALQAFEAEFDAPSQTIEIENIFGREGIGPQGGHHNDPAGGLRVPLGCDAYPYWASRTGLCGVLLRRTFSRLARMATRRRFGLGPPFAFDKDRHDRCGHFWPPAAWRGNQSVGRSCRASVLLSICRVPIPITASHIRGAMLVGCTVGPVSPASRLWTTGCDRLSRLPFSSVSSKVTGARGARSKAYNETRHRFAFPVWLSFQPWARWTHR